MSVNPIVLVIEGRSYDGETLTRALHSHRYHAIYVEDFEDALLHLESPIDLVLSGIDCNSQDGRNLLKQWTLRRPETPYVLLTTSDRVAEAQEAMERGATGYISLPFNGDETMAQIAKWLEGSGRMENENSERGAAAQFDSQTNVAPANGPAIQIPPGTTLEDLERAAVEQALVQHQGNRTHAAKELGISVRTLQRKLKAWGSGKSPRTEPPSDMRQSAAKAWAPAQPASRSNTFRSQMSKV